MTTWHDIVEIAMQYRADRIAYWLNEVLFSYAWWILLAVTITLLIIWILILDKKRILEIITYGMLVAIIANLGDTIGLSFSLWGYQYSLLHTPEILEIHNIMMPIIYMIMYQACRSWKSFSIVSAINAIIFALILEPLLIWLDIYQLFHWNIIYSIVPYFLIAVGLKWVIHRLKRLDRHYE